MTNVSKNLNILLFFLGNISTYSDPVVLCVLEYLRTNFDLLGNSTCLPAHLELVYNDVDIAVTKLSVNYLVDRKAQLRTFPKLCSPEENAKLRHLRRILVDALRTIQTNSGCKPKCTVRQLEAHPRLLHTMPGKKIMGLL